MKRGGTSEPAPAHPGAAVKAAIEALPGRVTGHQAALAMGVTPQMLGLVMNGKSAISPQMALLLAAYFGDQPERWLAMQAEYDLWHARQEIKPKLAKVKPAQAP